MRRLRFLPSARADFVKILSYVTQESGSLQLARRFVERLRARCRDLASLPGTMGRQRPELSPDLRSIVFGNYVIFFRYVGDNVEIVNVIEGHRDMDALFDQQ